MHVSVLWSWRETYFSTLRALVLFCQQGAIHRGLLYSGVVNVMGDELARGQLRKALGSSRDEVVSEFAGYPMQGVIEALVDVIVQLLNMGDRPDVITQAENLEAYLTLYRAVLIGWTAQCMQLTENIRKLLRTV